MKKIKEFFKNDRECQVLEALANTSIFDSREEIRESASTAIVQRYHGMISDIYISGSKILLKMQSGSDEPQTCYLAEKPEEWAGKPIGEPHEFKYIKALISAVLTPSNI